jgi:hypothetical protein
MTSPQQDNIPTLTDIIQPGDASMKDHFDARYFDKNRTPAEIGEPPLPEELKEILELLIQEALNETLPAIEEQLKTQLTEKVLQKLDPDSRH